MPFHRLDRLVEGAQIQPSHQVPDGSRRMIVRDEPLDIDVEHPPLTAIQRAQSRLGRCGRSRAPEYGLGVRIGHISKAYGPQAKLHIAKKFSRQSFDSFTAPRGPPHHDL